MFSYRLKSIKQPGAFCCEKVNKPVYLGQLSSYNSSKKGLQHHPLPPEFSISPSESYFAMFFFLCSLVKLSAKMHRREMKAVFAVVEGTFPGPCKAMCPKRKPAFSPEGCLITHNGICWRC